MNIITLDFETYFDDAYSLSKGYTTESYIRDKKFEVHGCSLKSGTGKSYWFAGEKLPDLFAQINWEAVLCHHAQFDGLILSHHYGIKPKFWFDTLSMARLLLGNHLSVGLDSLAKHFGLQAKTVPYNLFKGKHWAELPPVVQQQVADGACHDVDLTWQLFQILGKDFPRSEYEVVDTTIRLFTEPVLVADVPMLGEIWTSEETNKKKNLESLGVTAKELGSNARFAELLEAEGVEPEMKEGKKGAIYAFAKTDSFMQELLEDEDERVRTLAQARLGVKSSLLQTRAETLGTMANRGALCVYLRYCGTRSTRWSGGDKTNFQNIPPRIKPSIMAPENYLFGVIDAAQIQCRLLNYCAGQNDKVDDFRNGRDPYVGVATEFYGYEVNKNDHPEQRQVGKKLELACGFAAGAPKIRTMLRIAGIHVTELESVRARDAYRKTHPAVVNYWKTASEMLNHIADGSEAEWGPMQIKDHALLLPNGLPILHHGLEWYIDPEKKFKHGWRCKTRNGWEFQGGPKLIENAMQGLERAHIAVVTIQIKRMGYRVVGNDHDGIWVLIPKDGFQEEHLERCREKMKIPPVWLPGIPLDADASLGQRYSK